MTQIYAPGYISHPDRTAAEAMQAMEDERAVIVEGLGQTAETTLTINAGSITPTGAQHAVDTEAAAASDDLTNIAQTNHPDGRLLLIRAANATRIVTVKHSAGGAGQITLADSADFLLNDTRRFLLLKRIGTIWEEVLRTYGAASSAGVRVLARAVGTQDVVSTTTPTAVFSFSVPGGSLGTNRALRLTAAFDWLQGTGSAQQTPTFDILYGGQSAFRLNAFGAVASGASRFGFILDVLISAHNSAAAQSARGAIVMSSQGSVGGIATATGGINHLAVHNALTVDSTAVQTLAIQITNPVSNANYSTRRLHAHLELLGAPA